MRFLYSGGQLIGYRMLALLEAFKNKVLVPNLRALVCVPSHSQPCEVFMWNMHVFVLSAHPLQLGRLGIIACVGGQPSFIHNLPSDPYRI